jgi:cobalt-zinc-cadmium efflux system outer membrane protein
VDVGRTGRDRALAEQSYAGALADLRLLLAIDADEELSPVGELPRSAGPAELHLPTLLSQAANRPDLRAAREELEAARATQRLAQRLAFPNLRLGAGTANEERSQMFLGTFGMPLPLFNRNQAERGVTAARVSQAERALEAVERRVQQEVRLAISRRAAAVAAVEAYGGEAAQALQENLRLGYEAYRSGKLDFLQLMLIRRETLEARRSQIDTLEELNNAAAQLRRVLGSIQ